MRRATANAFALTSGLILAFATGSVIPRQGAARPDMPSTSALNSASLRGPSRSIATQPDYKSQYPQEYAFFKTAFDQANRNLYSAERDSAFSMFAQQVEALQKAGAKISLGGMLSLLVFEGKAGLAHYNTLCAENSYDKSNACWENPKARYGYQLGLGAFHTSNFHPCPVNRADQLWTRSQRDKFDQLALQVGFSPTAEQIVSVAAELRQFCPSAQAHVVDYYILRANDLGIPQDSNDNVLRLAGKYPLFVPSVSIAFFFSRLEVQPSQLTSDEQAISVWGNTSYYSKPQNQAAILALWNDFRAKAPTPFPAQWVSSPTFAPDNRHIAFVQGGQTPSGPRSRLCVADILTNSVFCFPESLTIRSNNTGSYSVMTREAPVFARDGRTVLFVAAQTKSMDCGGLYSAALDGTEFRRLTDCYVVPQHITVARKADVIAFNYNARIEIIDSTGRSMARFPLNPQETIQEPFDLSPDGTLLLYSPWGETKFLSIEDIPHHTRTLFPEVRISANLVEPRFSPDGSRVVFNMPVRQVVPSPDGDLYYRELCVLDVSTHRISILTNDQNADLHPVFSPDGAHIVFFSSGPQGNGLYSVGSEGGERRNLVKLATKRIKLGLPDVGTFAQSPRGDWLAFIDQLDPDRTTICIVKSGSAERRCIQGDSFR